MVNHRHKLILYKQVTCIDDMMSYQGVKAWQILITAWEIIIYVSAKLSLQAQAIDSGSMHSVPISVSTEDLKI